MEADRPHIVIVSESNVEISHISQKLREMGILVLAVQEPFKPKENTMFNHIINRSLMFWENWNRYSLSYDIGFETDKIPRLVKRKVCLPSVKVKPYTVKRPQLRSF